MEELKSKTADLAENVEQLVNTYYKLSVVKVVEKSSNILSVSLVAVIAFFLVMCFLFFAGIAAGIWVGRLLNNVAAGFLVVGAFYLLLMFILFAIRKKVILPFIGNIIIRKVYE